MNTYTEGKPYIFISYSSGDKDIVVKGVERLYEQYGLNIWYDENITGGTDWEQKVRRKIRDGGCRAVLFFASKKALMSENVRYEIQRAWTKKKVLFRSILKADCSAIS